MGVVHKAGELVGGVQVTHLPVAHVGRDGVVPPPVDVDGDQV